MNRVKQLLNKRLLSIATPVGGLFAFGTVGFVQGSSNNNQQKFDQSSYYPTQNELNQFINIAFTKIDQNGIEIDSETKNKWTIHNTKDDNISVIYRIMDDNSNDSTIYTVRGQGIINMSFNDLYNYLNSKSNVEMLFEKEIDPLCLEKEMIESYDNDHCLCYAAFKTNYPSFIISPRDFVFIKTRFELYTHDENVCGVYFNSITNENDKLIADSIIANSNNNNNGNFVRGIFRNTGYVFYQCKDDANKCVISYIVNVDPCGSIPSYVVNSTAPEKGMNVKNYIDNVNLLKQMLDQH